MNLIEKVFLSFLGTLLSALALIQSTTRATCLMHSYIIETVGVTYYILVEMVELAFVLNSLLFSCTSHENFSYPSSQQHLHLRLLLENSSSL